MADIYLDKLTYYKSEIDDYRQLAEKDIETKLATKIDNIDKGAPGGVAPLSSLGDVPIVYLPTASYTQAEDKTNADTLITPETLHIVQEANTIYKSEKGAALGVPTLDANGKIPATQIPAIDNVNTYYVATISDMLALVNIGQGDRCIVHSDPDTTNNGEYIAIANEPADISGWGIVPATNAVLSVNGAIGTVTVDRYNTPELDTVIIDTLNNGDKINTNVSRIDTLETTVAPLNDKITEHERQLNIDTSKLGVDIDTIFETGYYEVNTNLPFNMSIGELKVGYDTNNPSRIIQELSDTQYAKVVRRQYVNNLWELWQDTPQTALGAEVTKDINNRPTFEQMSKAIVNTYYGTTDPTTDIGKDGDLYHKFPYETIVTVQQDISAENYSADGFFNLYLAPSSADLTVLSCSSEYRAFFVEFGSNEAPKASGWSIELNGTVIPLNVVYSTPHGLDMRYDSSYDSVVQGITDQTTFKLEAKTLSGNDDDYTKKNGKWYLTPVINKTFDYVKFDYSVNGSTLDITGDTFYNVLELDLTQVQRDAGVYMLTFSATFSYSATNSSAVIRMSLDNGLSWKVIKRAPKDTSDDLIFSYHFTKDFVPDSNTKLLIEAKPESSIDIIKFKYADIVMERKA